MPQDDRSPIRRRYIGGPETPEYLDWKSRQERIVDSYAKSDRKDATDNRRARWSLFAAIVGIALGVLNATWVGVKFWIDARIAREAKIAIALRDDKHAFSAGMTVAHIARYMGHSCGYAGTNPGNVRSPKGIADLRAFARSALGPPQTADQIRSLSMQLRSLGIDVDVKAIMMRSLDQAIDDYDRPYESFSGQRIHEYIESSVFNSSIGVISDLIRVMRSQRASDSCELAGHLYNSEDELDEGIYDSYVDAKFGQSCGASAVERLRPLVQQASRKFGVECSELLDHSGALLKARPLSDPSRDELRAIQGDIDDFTKKIEAEVFQTN